MDSMYLSRPSRLWKSKADFFRPFRSAASEARVVQGSARSSSHEGSPQSNCEDPEAATLRDLNVALRTLVEVFPDGDPAVLRDMLSSISEESRVEVVTEQLLRRRGKTSVRSFTKRLVQTLKQSEGEEKIVRRTQPLQVEDTFRGEQYHNAVRTLLYQEFKNLGHPSIRAVMAENNGSYVRSRPVLQQLTTRTWRYSIMSLWNRRDQAVESADHPAVSWQVESGARLPSVIPTSSPQLDNEIHDLFVKPKLDQHRCNLLLADQSLAYELNTTDAERFESLFDCECCYASVAFEEIACCSSGEHFLCFDCIRRTTSEALYGQGWARTADLDRASIRCFAPALTECTSAIPRHSLKHALEADLTKPYIWQEYQSRVSSESLLKSRIPLTRCPNCPYAEVDTVPSVRLRDGHETAIYLARLLPWIQPEVALPVAFLLSSLAILLEAVAYAVFLPIWSIWLLLHGLATISEKYLRYSSFLLLTQAVQHNCKSIIETSTKRLYRQRRGPKFRCQHPDCGQVSCLRCLGVWRDPHVCFEDEKTSLRTAVEASATAAVKRTCPKCMLSFIKSSGCNKLVCNCGYTMCYICRAEITAKEGYAHFCQHFRPNGGRCIECERCDLYGDEDEEAAIRQAAMIAEQQWRQKEALKGGQAAMGGETAKVMIEAVLEQDRKGQWYEQALDQYLDARVVFVDDTTH